MTQYRLQISNDFLEGAERFFPGTDTPASGMCSHQLNSIIDAGDNEIEQSASVKFFITELVSLIKMSACLMPSYKKKFEILNDANKTFILVVGVGIHNKEEIRLFDEKGECAKEIAHIDKEPFDGARRMNRLFVFDTKPKEITFHNTHEKTNEPKTFQENQIKFMDNCATIILDLDK
jgi:hypothetical protein